MILSNSGPRILDHAGKELRMVSLFIWTVNEEWVPWMRCPRRQLAQVLEIAERARIQCDWIAW